MRPGECGTAYPPADGTPEGEAIDRFRDFLATVGGPPVRPTKADPGEYPRQRFVATSPAHAYRVRFMAWRSNAFDPTADRQLLPWWEATP